MRDDDDAFEEDTRVRAKVRAERRASPRIPLEFEVMVHSAKHLFPATSLDFSSGGLFVATYRPLPVGTRVVLDFKLPNRLELEIEGVVRWCRGDSSAAPGGMGVEFAALSPQLRAALEQFCAVREPLYFGVAS